MRAEIRVTAYAMNAFGPRTILIDGYNVIRNVASLAAAERQSLARGREALVAQVVARYRHTPHRVVIVFDGDGPAESTQALPGLARCQVVFSCNGETADTVIARMAQAERARGAEVIAVSDDFEVRSSVAQSGGRGTHVQALSERLNEAPTHQRRMARHRMYVRQQWYATEDDPQPPQRGGNPRRNPRRRSSSADRPLP